MVRKDGAETKKERLTRIAQLIQSLLYKAKEQGIDFISLEKASAIIEFEVGLSPQKVQEYLLLIKRIGQIEIDSEKDHIRKSSVV